MAVRTAPATFEELVAQYDHFITVTIFKISKGAVRTDDVPDLKQAIYARMLETDYLSKYRPEKGSFSNYLFVLIRSVLVNQFSKNCRNPLNNAYGIVESGTDVGMYVKLDNRHVPHKMARGQFEDPVPRLVLEAHKDFEDAAWERRQEVNDLIDRMEQHATSLKDGEELATVLRMLYDGHAPGEIAKKLGRTTAKVAEYRRRLKKEMAAEFEELAG